MVTKHTRITSLEEKGSVLAKILMVTKLQIHMNRMTLGSVLAKILMVTKRTTRPSAFSSGSVLAKIHMVTKHITSSRYS